jgi:hypothetical protein
MRVVREASPFRGRLGVAMRRVKYGWSLAISIGLIAVIAGISSIPGCDNRWLLLLPGAFLAAVVLPQGVNSSGGNLYFVLAGLLDIFYSHRWALIP